MGFGSLLSKGIGMVLKYAPRAGKALGQISEVDANSVLS